MNSRGNNKADSLFYSGDYFQASIEYERLLFYANDRASANYFQYQKALCYKNSGDFPRAIHELQSIYFSSSTDSMYAPVSYQLSLCHFLNNEPMRALWKIEEFQHRSMDSAIYLQFLPVKILCLNETGEWEKAKSELLFFLEQNYEDTTLPDEITDAVEALYSKKSIPRLVDIKKAQILSKFIPGAGQLYAGKVGEGIVNLLLNATILAFSIHQLYYKFYITGYLGGLAVFNKTYQSSSVRAGTVARQKNEENISNFNRQITSLIQDSLK